jgi:electron-transferring-flavoprotein dehydrogenase
MLAAEAAYEKVINGEEGAVTLDKYESSIKDSWVYQELKEVRNVRPSFHNPLGLWGGLAYSGLDTMFLKGRVPWTFKHGGADHNSLKPLKEVKPIEYPKPDGVISFDLLDSVSRSGTNHAENQPIHLRLQRGSDPQLKNNYPVYGGPEQKFCPGFQY